MINILIFGSLISVGFSYISDLMDSMLSRIPDWLDFIQWILWPLIVITVSLITGYLFTTVALIIASPFNALLAEKAEELITGQTGGLSGGIGCGAAGYTKRMLRELLKLLYYMPMAFFVLLLSFIPGVGAVAWLLLGAWMMSIQFVDYPMDNHQLQLCPGQRGGAITSAEQHGVWRSGGPVHRHTAGQFLCGARRRGGRHPAVV